MSAFVGELLVYMGGALWMGYLVLRFISTKRKPPLMDGTSWAVAGLGMLVLGTSIPVIGAVRFLLSTQTMTAALRTGLLELHIGRMFLVVYFAALLILIILAWQKQRSVLLALLTIPLWIGIAGTSHAAAKYGAFGWMLQFSHFLCVTAWIGVVFWIAIGARSTERWSAFLSWFSPFARIAFIGVILSGLLLMQLAIPLERYTNLWGVPYGQALLLKHLLLLPLLFYAFCNGTLVRRRLRFDSTYDPRPLLRMESIILVLLFMASASLSRLEQPTLGQLPTSSPAGDGWVLMIGIATLPLLLLGYRRHAVGVLLSLFSVSLIYLGLLATG
ncbi:MAG TPA: hypothetical protein DD663_03980 [Exiguobacterium sp.]|nr:hypothetical protein [Exiguobacterium sp.]